MDLLEVAKKVANEAQVIAATYRDDAQVLSSVLKDIKTQADLQLNDFIIKHLLSTDIPVISEEIECSNANLPDQCWIIDPLDGTYNFTRGYPCAGISIALWQNNAPVLGIVKDIFTDDIYFASANSGSYLNEKRIFVSETRHVSDAIIATGFPSGASYQTDHLMAFVKNVQTFKKVRTIGAASLMLSYVAAGVFDVYYENDIYLWDVAAGLSLVEEAGGKIYYKARPGTMKYEVLACNPFLFEEAGNLLLGT